MQNLRGLIRLCDVFFLHLTRCKENFFFIIDRGRTRLGKAIPLPNLGLRFFGSFRQNLGPIFLEKSKPKRNPNPIELAQSGYHYMSALKK